MFRRIKFSTCVALSVVCLLSASFFTSTVKSRNVHGNSVSLQSTHLVGRVIGVADGDTITVLDSQNRQHKVRLAGIDAPEKGQGFTNVSKRNLSDLVFNKTITVIYHKKDRYGRLVGKVLVDGADVNLAQVKSGLAWHYKEYANEQSAADRRIYSSAEVEARKTKKGIWSQPNPVAPWDHRASNNSAASNSPLTYLRGPRGGCYYINSSGNKAYVDRSMCGDTPTKATNTESSSSSKYIRGPRGGCYYINSRGKKTYVSRSLCD